MLIVEERVGVAKRLAESMHMGFEVGFELLTVPRRLFVSEGGCQVRRDRLSGHF